MNSTNVRENIVNAMKLDLVGPLHSSDPKYLEEVLSIQPSNYYLTGFLVPFDARARVDVEEDDSVLSSQEAEDRGQGSDDASFQVKRYPSSIGLSFLLKKDTKELEVKCRWGEYVSSVDGEQTVWKRTHHEKVVPVILKNENTYSVPVVEGIELTINQKTLNLAGDSYGLLEDGTKSISIFLVNRKEIRTTVGPLDSFFMFQAEMSIYDENGFCPRPNLRALESKDRDDSIADLQFSSVHEYATGHGVAALFDTSKDICTKIKTSWIPFYEVEGVTVPTISKLELRMEELGKLKNFAEAKDALFSLVSEYRKWMIEQKKLIPKGIKKREETGDYLLSKYDLASQRIEQGIELLQDPKVFESFKLANQVMASSARQRINYEDGNGPSWRTFQLAFILMNLNGVVNSDSPERDIVDLLYFPTGGGKTEAYLGVVSFILIYRRLSDPSISSAGVSILMRYTLRLLTLDQLERATTLICALEKLRRSRYDLGEWPYEIGLWVGQDATPNKLGEVNDGNPYSARAKLSAYQNDRGKCPIPLEKCPWCGTQFEKNNSFKFHPEPKRPNDLHVICSNRDCDFTASKFGKLPLVIVDEVIYRRLPCFIISTVDKLASMPWEEKIGKLFGNVDKYGELGFYSPSENVWRTNRLASPLKPLDLIIQDELHLISGPLGTVVGLYESAVDELSAREINGKKVKTKIIASTATVRHAQKQVKSLFARQNVDIFPVPGITSKDSFFAKTIPSSDQTPGRIYLGIAAQGRSTKNLLMKSYLASMSAAQKQLELNGDSGIVDPYLTALGYFNSLRELGGARRIIEDEVNSKLRNYSKLRKRHSEESSELVADRTIKFDVLELTSRVDTADVALAKHRLSKPYGNDDFVNVAIATNMISVGLDITRLGLMLVFGQPKTTAEYIQASSRVGRGKTPGLVVTLYNIHRHRDRSLYEKFLPYHQSYYRDVETTSVTPFSTKALDKGLAGTYLSLVRHLIPGMQRSGDAAQIIAKKTEIKDSISKILIDRLKSSGNNPSDEAVQRLNERLSSLLDDWEKILHYSEEKSEPLTYTGSDYSLIHQYLDLKLEELPDYYMKFRANRSMREVEPTVNIWVRGKAGQDLED